MRYYAFMSLLAIAIVLDLGLLTLGLLNPRARLFRPRVALAAAPAIQAAPAVLAPAPTARAILAPQKAAPPPPSPPPPAATPQPVADCRLPTAGCRLPAADCEPICPRPAFQPAAPPPAPRLLAANRVTFTPMDRAVRANIRLALALGQGRLTHVVLAPGEVFSFNAVLGPRPQRLPWKYVVVRPTPAAEAAPGALEAASPAEQRIQGGGLCDLASRFVMAARPLLPARSFRFVNHLRSNGVRLRGVPARDSVSIWAVGGGPGEQDLRITNSSEGWLEFTVMRDGESISVTAELWDRAIN